MTSCAGNEGDLCGNQTHSLSHRSSKNFGPHFYHCAIGLLNEPVDETTVAHLSWQVCRRFPSNGKDDGKWSSLYNYFSSCSPSDPLFATDMMGENVTLSLWTGWMHRLHLYLENNSLFEVIFFWNFLLIHFERQSVFPFSFYHFSTTGSFSPENRGILKWRLYCSVALKK